MSTSYEQKIEHSKKDGASDTSRIDAASDILSRLSFDSRRRLEGRWLDISKDGELIFKDPPPKEDCQNTTSMSICANCGKEGTDVTNTCNKCNLVMYCNAVCKKKHRSKHKKQCERRVAELQDEKLFKEPPSEDDCPICYLMLPKLGTGRTYMACCGKIMCCGCIHAPVYDNQGNVIAERTCPFCRTPAPTSDEKYVKRYKHRSELNDADAILNLGGYYALGEYGLSQNMAKALELWHRAGELDSAQSYYNIGIAYDTGDGVALDERKAIHYYELAAIGGNVHARHNLGCTEGKSGNYDRALKHWMIAAGSGYTDSLKNIKRMCKSGLAMKDDYANALRAYQAHLDKIKSDLREKAAAAYDQYKYYESALLKDT